MSYKEVLDEMFKANEIKAKSLDEVYKQGNYILNIADRCGLVLSDEQLRYVMFDSDKLLCEAGAGTGKTTMSQLKNIRFELFHKIKRDRILNVVYNEHAKHVIFDRFELMAKAIGMNWRESIQAKTFHSLALEWITEYKEFLGYKSFKVIDNDDQLKYIKVCLQKAGVKNIQESLPKDVLLFISYIIENMLSEEEYLNSYEFCNLGLSKKELDDTIMYYDKIKHLRKVVDYTDFLVLFKRLFDTNPDFVKRFNNYYDVISVDEYQDFSNLMDYIFYRMEVPIRIAIGDTNQSIYEFRGANPYKNFKETYGGDSITLLRNRRCKSKIVDCANKILRLQEIQKCHDTIALNEGGEVEFIGYNGGEHQMTLLVNYLKNLKDLNKTTICFRNREQSFLVSYSLLIHGIPFRLGNVKPPLSDLLSRSLTGIFGLLRNPTNGAYQASSLYKLLPGLRKNILNDIVKKNKENFESVNFWDLDFPESVKNVNGFMEALSNLKGICLQVLNKVPINKIFADLYAQFMKYYWLHQRTGFDIDLEKAILKLFNTEGDIDFLLDRVNELLGSVKNSGVYLTTFHGLKGLEFENVIVVDFNESIIPNKAGLVKYGDDYQKMLESANRLMYVVITRAKTKLTFFYDKANPSYYKYILEDEIKVTPSSKKGEFKKTFKVMDSDEINDLFNDLF